MPLEVWESVFFSDIQHLFEVLLGYDIKPDSRYIKSKANWPGLVTDPALRSWPGTLWGLFPPKGFNHPISHLDQHSCLTAFSFSTSSSLWLEGVYKQSQPEVKVLCHPKAWKPSTKIHTQHDNGRTINTYRETVKFHPVTGSSCWTWAITRTCKEKRNEIENHA